MPRTKGNISSKQIQRIRGNWYVFHFNMRQAGRLRDPIAQKKCQAACELLPRVQLRLFGGIALPGHYSYQLARQIGVDVDLLNPWYLSDAGWENFQTLWKSLPEPVDLSTGAYVQIGELSTIVHRDDDEDLQNERELKVVHNSPQDAKVIHRRVVDKS